MGVGIASTEIKRIEHEGWWFDAKVELSAGEMRFVRRGFITVGPDGQPQIKGDDPEQYNWNLIRAGVAAWSFSVPITDEGISRLTDATVTQIVRDLNELYTFPESQKKA